MLRTNKRLSRATALGAAATVVVGGFVAVTQSPAFAAPATYTASPKTGGGPTGDTVVSITGKDFQTASGVSKVLAVTGVKLATGCGTTAATVSGEEAGGIASFSVASATRIVATVHDPALGTNSAKKDYKICVYATGGSNALLGSTTFTAYPVPTVTHVNGSTTDAKGSAAGGQTIALDGTNFTSKSVVKVNGVAATGVKVVDATSLTAVTPAGTPATNVNVTVTTEGGTSAAWAFYDYVNAISVSPSNGPNAGGNTITVKGVGFDALTLTGAGSAKVFFLTGAYDPTDAGSNSLPDNNYGETCLNVQRVSDKELTCDVPAALGNDASYRVVVVPDTTGGALSLAADVNVFTVSSVYTSADA